MIRRILAFIKRLQCKHVYVRLQTIGRQRCVFCGKEIETND